MWIRWEWSGNTFPEWWWTSSSSVWRGSSNMPTAIEETEVLKQVFFDSDFSWEACLSKCPFATVCYWLIRPAAASCRPTCIHNAWQPFGRTQAPDSWCVVGEGCWQTEVAKCSGFFLDALHERCWDFADQTDYAKQQQWTSRELCAQRSWFWREVHSSFHGQAREKLWTQSRTSAVLSIILEQTPICLTDFDPNMDKHIIINNWDWHWMALDFIWFIFSYFIKG